MAADYFQNAGHLFLSSRLHSVTVQEMMIYRVAAVST
jgi:hypothetical protein